MGIIIGGNTLSGNDFNPSGYTVTPSVVTRGLVLWLDAGNDSSYRNTSNYYDCGYGCQYYSSNPGCTNCNTQWKDMSGFGNDGTFQNGASISYNSASGGVIFFDGTNDYTSIGSSSTFAFGTGNFTLDVWIYPYNFSSYVHMIALPDQNTFALKANINDGAIYFYTPTYTTAGSTTGWTLTANTWNNVIFKRESSVGYAFLNGVSKGSKTGFTNNFSTQAMNIHYGGVSEFSSCGVSVIKVYNRSLTNDEIIQNFNNTRSRFGI
jgi:hypothetical protein